MSIIRALDVDLADADATLAAGAHLARGIVPGMVLALTGELGAGKTTLVRGALRALGWTGAVKSPTYAWVEHYVLSNLGVYHFDFYRLRDPSQWDASGFAEYFRADTICMVEWPERVSNVLAVRDVGAALRYRGDARTLTLSAHTATGDACLEAFVNPP